MFGTVLVARKNSDKPSELEIALRKKSQKLRVVSKLSGGAHFLLPGAAEGSNTVAVRVYDSKEIFDLEERRASSISSTEYSTQFISHISNKSIYSTPTINNECKVKERDNRNTGTTNQCIQIEENSISDETIPVTDVSEIDSMNSFRNTYRYSVIFFVIPPGEMQRDQLGRADSIVMRSQFCLGKCTRKRCQPEEHITNDKQKPMTKIFIVPDFISVLRTIKSVVDSIQPRRKELQKKYFEMEGKKNGLALSGLPPCDDAITCNVRSSFRDWSVRNNVTVGDTDVLLSILGNLNNVISAKNLDNIPMNECSKQKILKLFRPKEREKVFQNFPGANATEDCIVPQNSPYVDHNMAIATDFHPLGVPPPPARTSPEAQINERKLSKKMRIAPTEYQEHFYRDSINMKPPQIGYPQFTARPSMSQQKFHYFPHQEARSENNHKNNCSLNNHCDQVMSRNHFTNFEKLD